MQSIYFKLYSFIRFCLTRIAPLWLIRYFEKYKELKLENKNLHYPESDTYYVVYIIDGRIKHGGLADRINGIISTFKIATKLNRQFRIYFVHPFNLSQFLIPHKYNWEIKKSELEVRNSKIIYLRRFAESRDKSRGIQLLNAIKAYPNSQIHVYTNINDTDNLEFQYLFHLLFQPSDRLRELIQNEFNSINSPYISATFRFQQLLGDFKEGKYKKLSDSEANNLIIKCKEKLIYLHNLFPTKKILVTSDSLRFIQEARELKYVITLKGVPIHMEYTTSSDFDTHAKSFIDLFMLSKAEVLYSIVIKPMYNSGFPKLASRINNRPFEIITDD